LLVGNTKMCSERIASLSLVAFRALETGTYACTGGGAGGEAEKVRNSDANKSKTTPLCVDVGRCE